MTQGEVGGREDVRPDSALITRASDSPPPGRVDLFIRIHAVGGDDLLVVSRDFGSELEATEAITRALDVRRSLTLTRASFNRESGESVVVVNLTNVVAVRVSRTDSAATGQYL